jgi:hypothetical protein
MSSGSAAFDIGLFVDFGMTGGLRVMRAMIADVGSKRGERAAFCPNGTVVLRGDAVSSLPLVT